VICNREAASVEAAAQRWAGQVDFVGVAWHGSDAEFAGFIDKHKLTFPQLSDDAGEIYARFEIPAQPALAVVDRDGAITTRLGAVDEGTLDDLLSGVGGDS
jgi:peroxiredoxin